MKNTILLSVILLVAVFLGTAGQVTAQAPDSWTQKASVGGPGRQDAAGFSIGGKGYTGTGDDINGIKYRDFWEYDPVNNAWTQKADFGGSARHSAAGFSIGTKGYIGTGQDATGYRKDFWEYDPVNNAWTQKADFGGPARWQAAGFSVGALGYIGTGHSPSTGLLADIWEYDPGANAWTQKLNFPGPARSLAVTFTIGQKAYLGTGNTQPAYASKDFWEFEPVDDNWTQKADFGGVARSYAAGFSVGSMGYIGTGTSNPALLSDFWEYDPSVDAWAQKAGFGGGQWEGAVGFSIGSKGYFGTGVSILTGTTNGFWEYTPSCPTPVAAGPIAGPINVCQGGTGYVYTVPPVAGATSYTWITPPCMYITSGSGTDSITVGFSGPATGFNTLSVMGANSCGNGPASPGFVFSLNPVPFPPVVSANGYVLSSNYTAGNQWYYEGTPIAGATGATYTVTHNTGYYWCAVTLLGCTSPISNKVWVEVTGMKETAGDGISLCPVPCNGRFVLSLSGGPRPVSVSVFDPAGRKVYGSVQDPVAVDIPVDLGKVPAGIYFLVVTDGNATTAKKIVVL